VLLLRDYVFGAFLPSLPGCVRHAHRGNQIRGRGAVLGALCLPGFFSLFGEIFAVRGSVVRGDRIRPPPSPPAPRLYAVTCKGSFHE
jgi:hypothetical protein